jgi:DNA-binding NarL/FixJ family response regulator
MDIYLVEDSPLVLDRLKAMLGTVPGARVVGHAEGADEAIQEILDRRPDLVVLDLRLAQGSGFDVLRTLRPLLPRTEFCMLSSFASEPYRQAAKQLGAIEFFDKTRDVERMLDLVAARAGFYAHA